MHSSVSSAPRSKADARGRTRRVGAGSNPTPPSPARAAPKRPCACGAPCRGLRARRPRGGLVAEQLAAHACSARIGRLNLLLLGGGVDDAAAICPSQREGLHVSLAYL